MKKIHIILLAMIGLAFSSCQKDGVTFDFTEIDSDQTSQVRVLSVIPVTGSSDTLLMNGQKYSSVITAMGSYYPASTPKYFAVPIGNTTISLRYAARTAVPTVPAFTYSNKMTLTKGKWSAYVYNAAQPPILLQDADDVPTTDAWNDTVCFIKAANFFFKADGVTPYGNISIKVKKNITGAAWETVASNIAFGTQSAAYYQYRLKNTGNSAPWSGTEPSITVAIFDASDNQFQSFTSSTSSAKGALSSTGWSFGKGRAYVIYLNGKEGTSNSTDQQVRLSSYTAK
jgi:hypothetical protein